jgi:hypothetical protein
MVVDFMTSSGCSLFEVSVIVRPVSPTGMVRVVGGARRGGGGGLTASVLLDAGKRERE